MALTTETPEECDAAVEAGRALKKCLDATIGARTQLVQGLKGLLAHQRAAAEEASKAEKLDAANKGVKNTLEDPAVDTEHAAKRAKVA